MGSVVVENDTQKISEQTFHKITPLSLSETTTPSGLTLPASVSQGRRLSVRIKSPRLEYNSEHEFQESTSAKRSNKSSASSVTSPRRPSAGRMASSASSFASRDISSAYSRISLSLPCSETQDNQNINQQRNRSAFTSNRVSRRKSLSSRSDSRNRKSQDTSGWTSDEDFNFDSDGDDEVFKNPDPFSRDLGHTPVKIESDITVKTYRRACRKLSLIPHSTVLRSLVQSDMTIRYGSLGESGTKACAIALVYNDRVSEVDLTGNDIGDLGAQYIADVLSYNSYITSLTLSENSIGLSGLQSLCEEIATNRYISLLNISDNNFGDSAAQYICDMLKVNNTLLELNISKNSMLEKGGILLGQALECNRTLEELNISWNHMRMKGVIGLCTGIKSNKSLKHLHVGWNGFYLQGCTAMAEALEVNITLQTLDLANNRINLECLNQLLNGFNKNKTLKGINLDMNPIGTDGAEVILKTIVNNPKCALININIESQTVYTSFILQLEQIQETRTLNITYGTLIEQASEVTQTEDCINDDPLIVLMEYMRQKNMRLLDLFNSLDADGSKSLSREEFREGLMDVNLPLSSQSLDKLLDELDIDGDGEVDFGELMEGQKEFRRRISRIQANKSHTSDDNKFTRIQKKVKALLQAREAIQKMKKLVNRTMSTEVRRTSFDSNQTTSESLIDLVKSGTSVGNKVV